MTETLRVEADGHILRMAFARPEKKNAVDMAMLVALAEAYTRLDHDPALRCGVVYGEGPVFTAGLDLAAVLPRFVAEGPSAYLADGRIDPFGLYGPPCRKPVVVAAHGRCYTVGLELTLAADLCVAARGTVFGQQEVTRGIFPFGGATLRLPAVVGWHAAMKAMLAGDTFTAEEAAAMGLVQTLADPGAHVDAALALAGRVAANAPLAVQAALKNARMARSAGFEAARDDLIAAGRVLATSRDAREGMLSLMEKRRAVFTGE